MHFGIIVFPGTNCERDCLHVVRHVIGHSGALVWHEEIDLSPYDALILPGGFAHGDYLRTGAMASHSPVMDSVEQFAELGKPVIGICNGFQILCEAGFLPGALRRNETLHFVCRDAHLRVERADNQFLHLNKVGDVLRMPVRHGEGSYYVDPDTLVDMEAGGQILLRYCDANGLVAPEANPNGSVDNIAGVMNADGTIFGLMPHPEAAAEILLGSADGLFIFRSMIEPLAPGRARTRNTGIFDLDVDAAEGFRTSGLR
ncbi:MAG: phosphoribosylformylglycinamidine synthase subunit PurQ [Armatimonadota bacterium]|nr:phosphoribosylformylglycinamidine synthase subunit PurQ [Armatimonadota bacterium]